MPGLNKTFLFEKYWYDAHPSKYFDKAINKGARALYAKEWLNQDSPIPPVSRRKAYSAD
jgi:hypothetical protein